MKELAIVILILISITFSYSQTDSVPTWIGRETFNNQFELLKAPFSNKRYMVISAGVVSLTVGSIFLFDQDIRSNVSSFSTRNTDFKTTFEYITYGGNMESIIGITAGSYLYGRLAKNEKWQKTGELLGVALVNTALVTYAFKLSFARQRPYVSGKDHWHFFAIDEDKTSFFSGHSSASFTVASILALQNKNRRWVKWVAYGSAAAISFSRIVIDKHWSSDVFLGAAIGYGIGHFTHRSLKKKNFYILPFRSTTNETGLSLTLVF